MNTSKCIADLACSQTESCLVCPFSYALSTLNNNTLTQICLPCDAGLNCARCLPNDTSVCISCPYGLYLNGSLCSNCAKGCAECISLTQCRLCATGFLPTQSGSLSGNSAKGLLTCVACSSPCASCRGDPTFCSSCPNGFVLSSGICLTNFNYVMQVVFATTLLEF